MGSRGKEETTRTQEEEPRGRTPYAVVWGPYQDAATVGGSWGLVPGVGAGQAAVGDVPASVGSLKLQDPRTVSSRRRGKEGRSRMQGQRAEGGGRDSQVGPQNRQESLPPHPCREAVRTGPPAFHGGAALEDSGLPGSVGRSGMLDRVIPGRSHADLATFPTALALSRQRVL